MTALCAAAGVNSGAVRAKASSVLVPMVVAILSVTAMHSVYAQRPAADSSRADSLAIRLRRAEQAIEMLQQQLVEQAAQGATTRSRMKLELNGRVLVHSVRNSRDVNNADDPQFATSVANTAGRFVMTARQTTLGAALTANDVLGGHFIGDLDVDFYGGQLSASGGRTFPLIRLRTFRGIVRWSNGELLMGQEAPLITGVNPVSPAAIGTPLFATAGNLWLWLPQLRATLETDGAVRVGVQAAMVANVTGDAVGTFDTSTDPGESSGRPGGEARVRVRWGEAELRGEIGCGGHAGWIAPTTSTTRSTYAAACDARIPLTSSLELRGEAYAGRGLRGLGGGGIGQNLATNGEPLKDRGGWGQVNIDATPALKLGAGCGIDAPTETDVPVGGRLRNQSCAGYGMLRPAGPLLLGLELRQTQTKYAAGTFTNYHISLATGFEF